MAYNTTVGKYALALAVKCHSILANSVPCCAGLILSKRVLNLAYNTTVVKYAPG